MCVTCGCGQVDGKDATIDGDVLGGHDHKGCDGPLRHHDHEGLGEPRRIRLEEDLLGKNNRLAATNRRVFRDSGTFVVNLVSGPGSGKTTLLARTAADLRSRMPVAVIEGDQETENDAARIREIARRVGSNPMVVSRGMYRWASSHTSSIGAARSRSLHNAKSKTIRHKSDTRTSTISDGTPARLNTVIGRPFVGRRNSSDSTSAMVSRADSPPNMKA